MCVCVRTLRISSAEMGLEGIAVSLGLLGSSFFRSSPSNNSAARAGFFKSSAQIRHTR